MQIERIKPDTTTNFLSYVDTKSDFFSAESKNYFQQPAIRSVNRIRNCTVRTRADEQMLQANIIVIASAIFSFYIFMLYPWLQFSEKKKNNIVYSRRSRKFSRKKISCVRLKAKLPGIQRLLLGLCNG